MHNKLIPIVFSANDNYVLYTGVAIYSLIANANDNYKYNIYILHTRITDKNQKLLKRFETENVDITFFDVNEYMEEKKRHTSDYLSVEAVYRLLIPEIFGKYKKVLYLDSDIVVTGDISELYQIELENNILGAVHELLHEDLDKYWREHLQMDLTEGFNSGVLLINTELFQENKIKEKCFKLLYEDWNQLEKKYIYMDQDVLNITCRNKVKFLDSTWNFLWYPLVYDNIKVFDDYKKEFQEAYKNHRIIHYTSRKKPWQHPEYPLSDIFWEYARNAELCNEIQFNNYPIDIKKVNYVVDKTNAIYDRMIDIYDKINRKGVVVDELFKYHIFPFDMIPRKSNIVIYGAGGVGDIFQEQVHTTNYCTLLLWVDKRYKDLREKGLTVSSPESIKRVPYDYVVIAVEDLKIAEDIRNELVDLGIEKDKIIWTEPNNQ